VNAQQWDEQERLVETLSATALPMIWRKASRSSASANDHRPFAAQPETKPAELPTFELDVAQGKLLVKLKEPFDLLAETVEAATRVEATQGVASIRNEVWLPFVDDYRTKCAVPRPSFRLQLEEVTRLGLAA
jgi:hypothetical protein